MARSLLVGCVVALGLGLGAPAHAEEPLSFRNVVELGRRAAPEVRLEEADIDVARGELVGARLWSHENPTLELGAGRRWARDPTLDREVSLAVPIELGGKRSRRIALARAVIARETYETTDARRLSGGAAAAAYFQVLYAERLVALAGDRRALADALVTTARERLASGDVAEFELNLAAAELARAESAIAAARGQVARALTRLAIELGLPSPDELEVRGDLSDRGFVGDAAAEIRADILAAGAQLEATDAAVALADSRRWPELSFRVTYAHEEDADILFGAVAFTLPVFDRNQGERAASRARRRRATIALEQTREIAAAQLEGARASYRAVLEALSRMEETAVPLAIENERLAREAYAAGKIDLTALLVVRREALEARQEHLDRLLQAALAGVDLWVAAGAELPNN